MHERLAMITRRNCISIIALLLIIAAIILSPICTRQVSAQSRNAKGAPGEISVQQVDPEVFELAKSFGSLSREGFVNWLNTVQRRNTPTEANRRQWITSYLQQSQMPVVENGDALYRLSERARPALRLFHREGIIKFIVFSHPVPYIESLTGACISITTGMLRQIEDDAQLNGLVAHELAHEYNDVPYGRAARARDFKTLRSYELTCDAIAALSLREMGMDPRELGQILFKTITWDESEMKANDGSGAHPSLASRLRLNELLAAELKKKPAEAKYAPAEPRS
jgi:hypothetical protein